MRSHRFFDHTGDFGADLRGDSEAEIFEAAVDALVGLLVEDVGTVESKETRTIEVQGVDEADLLVALGNEVLFLFETGWLTHHVVVREFEEDRLAVDALGEPFDTARHPIARPIKAVTHHGARIEAEGEAWEGRLIFDL